MVCEERYIMKLEFVNFVLKHGDKYIYEIDNVCIEENKFQLIGDNGSGKSSLMNVLYKENLNYEGSLKLNNVELRDIDRKQIRKKVSYINQNQMLIDTLSIRENVRLMTSDVEQVLKLISNMNGNIKLKARVSSLSGGQKQLVNFCIGFVKDSEILILDEVFNHLDKDVVQDVIKLIEEDDRDQIYITHKSIFEFENKYQIIDKEIIKI